MESTPSAIVDDEEALQEINESMQDQLQHPVTQWQTEAVH